jgi:hypothetical protein
MPRRRTSFGGCSGGTLGNRGRRDEFLHSAKTDLTERKKVGAWDRWRGFNGLPSNADGGGPALSEDPLRDRQEN